MMDFSFLDKYENIKEDRLDTPGELMKAWFDLLDGLTLVLLAVNAYEDGKLKSRRGYVVPKYKLVDSRSPVQ